MVRAAVSAGSRLPEGGLLARNVLWNLAGQAAPLLVAIVAIPLLLRGLGTERFGVLALAWVLIGYLGLFDLGLGRALTQLVAQRLGSDEDIQPVIWTSLALMLGLGLMGTVFLFLGAPWLVSILRMPASLRTETVASFSLLAVSVPFVIGTAGLRGILEAHQRFDLSNAIRIPMGVFTFLGPLLVLPFSSSLVPVVLALVVGRVIAWAAYGGLYLRFMPALSKGITLRGALVLPLMRFGGWMTVSNIVGPLMVYLDRFLIGAVLSIAAVAYYATPYEVVTKLWVIPGALAGVMFPAFSTWFMRDRGRTAALFSRSAAYLFLVLFPITLLIVAFSREGLQLWLGADFARASTRVLQWLAVAVFINSLAQISFALVQGAARPDLTAKLHLAELPLYVAALWWLLTYGGIEGAAIAWAGRAGLDMLVLFALAYRLLSIRLAELLRPSLALAVALVLIGLAALPWAPPAKVIFVVVALLAFGIGSWFLMLSADERAVVRRAPGFARGLRW